MNDHFDPEGAEGVYYTREPELFTIEIRGCDVDSEYAAEIARGVEVAKAEFAEIWPEHGERIVEEAKTALYTMAIFGMAYNPLANFLHGADFYVSRNVEGRETYADRFARFYGPAGRQERLERTLWALLSLLDPEVHEALRKRLEEEEAEAAQGEAEDDPAPKKKRPINPRRLRPNDNLPTITLTAGNIEEITNASEAALIKAERGIYQRNGLIVSVVFTDAPTAHGGRVIVQRIREKGDYALVEALSSAAHFPRWDANSKGHVLVDPPVSTVKTLRQRDRLLLPPLTGVINAPTMRHDGSILSEPGYDKRTGLLFDPRGVVFPKVPDRPTRHEALAALGLLKALISTFPFVGEVDRAVSLSAMLTTLIRRSLRTAPGHGFDAPAAGSGKSNLVNLASIIATGTEAAVTAVGPNDEEMEKRIGSDLLAGAPIIALDNCVRPLDGVILNQMLTQTQVKVRILGLSQSPTLISDAAVMATGNNLTIAGDLTRRVLVCRLDPKVDKPEERVFENDAVIDAMAGRPALVVAALTVLRAYNVAGRPQPEGVRPLGGFEEWTRMIRDALLWLGCADPVASMDRVRAADPVRVALMEVAAQWQEVIGNDRVTVAEAVALACGQEPWSGSGSAKFAHPEFREALLGVAGRGGVVNTKALGRWLASVKDRIVDGVRFEQHSGRAGVAAWELTKT